MKKQIRRISTLQTSKVIALTMFITTGLICLPFGIWFYLSGDSETAIAFFFYPLFNLVITFGASILFALVYNLVAKGFGGMEYDSESER